jgi:hypothetical protein
MSISNVSTRGVKGEIPIAGGAATVPGKLYTVFHASVPNKNGLVKVCPPAVFTASALATAVGLSGGTVAPTNVPLRATGVATGVIDDGDDDWGT